MRTTFTERQFADAYPAGIANHWWNQARCAVVADTLRRAPTTSGRLLEIGCGTGAAVVALRRHGFDCHGVELADTHVAVQAQAYVRTATDALSLSEQERGGYDTALLLDVLEHLPDPRAFLADVAGAFPNLKRILVTVPACAELWSNYDEYFGHVMRYGVDDVRALGTAIRWRTEQCRFFFHALYVPARLLGAIGLKRNTVIEAPSRWSVPLHSAIAALFVFESRVLPRRLPGTSLIGCFTRD